MARNRKRFIRHKTYFITFRTEAGLPFPPTLLMNRLLKGILGRAQRLYNLEVVCFKFMSNHFHLIITVIDPEVIKDFVKHIKKESAHAVNRLVGRKKRTIWCEGYDSPEFLDFEKLLEKMVYIYTNAQDANLADTIEQYPGLSSWDMLMSDNLELKYKRIRRSAIPVIGTERISLNAQKKLLIELEKKAAETNTFTLSPYAFMKSFEVDLTEDEIKALLIEKVREKEAEIREQRKVKVVDPFLLTTQAIELNYSPQKFSPRMICLGSCKVQRSVYISNYKRVCEEAYYLYQEAKKKCIALILPPGLYAPGGLLTANVWGSDY